MRDLARALGGQSPPCAEYAEAWVDDVEHAGDAEAAVEACQPCPALVECGQLADALGIDDGSVWGGTYRDKATARRRRKEAS